MRILRFFAVFAVFDAQSLKMRILRFFAVFAVFAAQSLKMRILRFFAVFAAQNDKACNPTTGHPTAIPTAITILAT